MKLVVGLGNPGGRYQGTRHNVGFMVADLLLSANAKASAFGAAFGGHIARARLDETDLLLLKPQTYMNRSGSSVAGAATYHGIDAEDILVVHDDVDLDHGTVRVKHGGGSGGHRGLNSCFEELGTRDFDRVRVGIGRPEPDSEQSVTDYVLEQFDEEQKSSLQVVLRVAAEAATATLTDGPTAAMNRYNHRGAAHGGDA